MPEVTYYAQVFKTHFPEYSDKDPNVDAMLI